MKVRVLLTAGALSLGLASASFAQSPAPMQPGMGGGQMQQGQMGDDMGQEQRPMKRSGKKMTKPMKSKKMMRSKDRMSGPGAETGEGM